MGGGGGGGSERGPGVIYAFCLFLSLCNFASYFWTFPIYQHSLLVQVFVFWMGYFYYNTVPYLYVIVEAYLVDVKIQ